MTPDDDDVLDDDGTIWRPAFDWTTPYDVMLRLADEYATASLARFRDQLMADEDLSAAACERMVRQAEPQVRKSAREAFISGWTRLQLEKQQPQ